jgi:hypothetical protein
MSHGGGVCFAAGFEYLTVEVWNDQDTNRQGGGREDGRWF